MSNGTPDMKGLANVQNMRMQFRQESQTQNQNQEKNQG